MFGRALSVVIAGACLQGCRTPTQITVVVTTDFPCSDAHGTTITIAHVGALERTDPRMTTMVCSDGRVGALVVVPSGGKSDEIAIKVVTGLTAAATSCSAPDYVGCIVARRALRFLPHTELTLPIVMRNACVDHPCDEARTCVQGQCVSETVPDPHECEGLGCGETTLTPGVDAGIADAPDAGRDAPDAQDAPDASTDAPDAGPPTSLLGDPRGLLSGAPWPMLNGTPSHAGVTSFTAPVGNTPLWKLPGNTGITAQLIGPDGTIYYGDNIGYRAVDPVTHAYKWTLPLGEALGDPALGSDGRLYGVRGGSLLAIDRDTGKQLWETACLTQADVTLGPGPVAYLSGSGSACAIDTVTHAKLWQQAVPGADASATLGLDGVMYVGTGVGVATFDMATGKAGWEFAPTAGGGVLAPIILGDDLVYAATQGATGAVYGIEIKTGAQRWMRSVGNSVEFAFARGPDGTLYVGTSGSKLFALDPRDGSIIWSLDSLPTFYGPPLVVDRNSVILAPAEGRLEARDGKNNGKLLWSYDYGGAAPVVIAPGGNGLLYLLRTGSLDAIGP